eukprot:scaffold99379_cov57-Phaeocystis_antarctica.AAC.2
MPPSTPQTSSTSQMNSPTSLTSGLTSPPSADAASGLRQRHGFAKVLLGPLLPWSSSASSHSAKWPPLPTAKWSLALTMK